MIAMIMTMIMTMIMIIIMMQLVVVAGVVGGGGGDDVCGAGGAGGGGAGGWSCDGGAWAWVCLRVLFRCVSLSQCRKRGPRTLKRTNRLPPNPLLWCSGCRGTDTEAEAGEDHDADDTKRLW